MVTRTKEYDLKVGDERQIKIIDIEAPVRFLVESGTFTYEVLLNDQQVAAPAAVASGVVTAPGGAWGSEIRIACTGAGKLHVAHTG